MAAKKSVNAHQIGQQQVSQHHVDYAVSGRSTDDTDRGCCCSKALGL